MSAAITADSFPHGDEHAHDAHHVHHGFFRTYVWSHDHKMIGLQYLFASFFFGAISGLLAMGVRWQLGFPGKPFPVIGHFLPQNIVGPDGAFLPGGYNMLVTMHATIMVFFVIMPLLIGVFGNFLIPLKIGAPDMAFPFFNELSFWMFTLSGVIVLSGFWSGEVTGFWHWLTNDTKTPIDVGGAAAGGWTSYAPLSSDPAYNSYHYGQSAWAIGIFVNGLASIAGAFNYITTIINMRCPGMTMFRLPLAVWSLFVTAVLLLLAVPVLSAAGAMLWLDLNMGTTFFSGRNGTGGDPLLYQHLFWFFGHPEVYIMILPAMGLVSEIMPVFARKPIFGYRAMAFSMIAIGFLGFIVWGHHMFVSGMNLVASAVFSFSTMVIAVPSAIKTFNWMGTIWKGSIRFTVPMCFCLAFVSMFVIGGLSGIFMASTPVDLFIHHTYFIVAHFHYVLFGGSLFALQAAVYFWFPKMFGRMMNEKLGYWNFWLMFIFFNLTFFPMHTMGLAGMMRRIADPTQYEHLRYLQPLQKFISIMAFGLGASFLVFWYNFFWSLRYGEKASGNPWRATTLEWTLPSPVTLHGNFPATPRVYHGPYEYSIPGMEDDFLPQNVPMREVKRTAGVEIPAHQPELETVNPAECILCRKDVRCLGSYPMSSATVQRAGNAAAVYSPWRHAYAAFVALCILVLICSGGMVTSKDAGLTVPDWPNSYGYNMFAFPVSRWVGGIFFEHTHRLIASFVGLLTVGLAVWLARAEPRRWVRSVGYLAVGAVILQGILGGLRVTMLKDWIGVPHALLAQAFFALMVFLALTQSRWWLRLGQNPAAGGGASELLAPLRRNVAVVTTLIYLQLGLGAAMRHAHAGLSILDFPTAYGHWWPHVHREDLPALNLHRTEDLHLPPTSLGQIHLQMTHRMMAGIILLGVLSVAWLAWKRRALLPSGLRWLGTAWPAVLAVQITLGIYTIWTQKAADVATAHVAVGATSLVWGVVTYAALRRWTVANTTASDAGI